jgi:hypothetical protein
VQLQKYLQAAAGQKHRQIYGAIAVEKTVRFYKFDWKAKEIKNVAENDAYFHIDRQCQTVTRWLRFVRDNHFEMYRLSVLFPVRRFREGTCEESLTRGIGCISCCSSYEIFVSTGSTGVSVYSL